MRQVLIIVAFFVSLSDIYSQHTEELKSPDGKMSITFLLGGDGLLRYSVNYQEYTIVEPSLLGVNGWSDGFTLKEVSFHHTDIRWKPVYGERSLVRDHFNGMVVSLIKGNNQRQQMQLEFRAYDGGVAFRYVFPEHEAGGRDVGISHDLTEFTLPEGTRAWFTPRAQGTYSLMPLEKWPGECERPLLLNLPNGWYACLAEAEMVDFSRMKFILHPSKANTIACSLYDRVDLTSPFATPWRVIMAAEKPGAILENNDLILNLNPPCEIANTRWIKPGKVMREVTLSAKGAKELVDFAVKRNLQYIHFDAGWYGYEYLVSSDATTVTVDPRRNPESDLDLHEAIRYANENGIGVILYINQRALYRQLDELLPLLKKWGVSGIKFGFVHVGSHRWTTWMHEAIKKCAQYNLLVNVHDEYRPTGFSRTYPNFMTQEGIHGNEEMPDATHNTVLPFTRFVAGAADYTVCYYHRPEFKPSLQKTQFPRVLKTTSAHQLALPVLYYSPLQYMYWYDKPSDSQDEPELEFFDRVPVVWDETRVLHGAPGEFVTIARRSGDHWFVGTITSNEGRTLKVPLDFLPIGKNYEATIYSDDPANVSRTKVAIKKTIVDSKTVLNTPLLPSGGQAVWIKPL